MTNKEILQADMLDILFEHRNKSYGAYALRRHYNSRLFIALGIALSVVVLIYIVSLLNGGSTSNIPMNGNEPEVVKTTNVQIQPAEKQGPLRQKTDKVKPVREKDFQTFKIVANKLSVKPIATQEELNTAAISNKDVEGPVPDETAGTVSNSKEPGAGEKEQHNMEPVTRLLERMPTFPGGPEALASFFLKNLSSPADLEEGEKKLVLVRFVVGADGAVTKLEIVQSGGDSFDREVIRAFKKMPRWNPAIQNGVAIAVSFTQPVTFAAVDQ